MSVEDDLLTNIAQKYLDIDTLETKNSGLDFHECAVWSIKDALQHAFEAGVEVGATIK